MLFYVSLYRNISLHPTWKAKYIKETVMLRLIGTLRGSPAVERVLTGYRRTECLGWLSNL
jgi:hypothetical protein